MRHLRRKLRHNAGRAGKSVRFLLLRLPQKGHCKILLQDKAFLPKDIQEEQNLQVRSISLLIEKGCRNRNSIAATFCFAEGCF